MHELVPLKDLRPNNWYINQAKLDRVREAWRLGEQDLLPPVLIAHIDGELGLIDGHARTYAAFENGATRIKALVQDLADIEGSRALYRHIHREGPNRGVLSIADLKDRIVTPEEHKRLWIDYCQRWRKEHDPSGDTQS